jgi:hypothetical protein
LLQLAQNYLRQGYNKRFKKFLKASTKINFLEVMGDT